MSKNLFSFRASCQSRTTSNQSASSSFYSVNGVDSIPAFTELSHSPSVTHSNLFYYQKFTLQIHFSPCEQNKRCTRKRELTNSFQSPRLPAAAPKFNHTYQCTLHASPLSFFSLPLSRLYLCLRLKTVLVGVYSPFCSTVENLLTCSSFQVPWIPAN